MRGLLLRALLPHHGGLRMPAEQTTARKSVLRLFLAFLQYGCFTFGGGWSIVAQMEKKYVEKEKSLTSQELLDLTSVGRSLPGIMIGNVAFLYGHRQQGIPGGLACLFGMVIPPVLILTLVTFGYGAVRDNVYVARAMAGVRASVVPIIASATLRLRKGAFPYPACILLMVLALGLNLLLHISSVILILLGAGAGLLLCERMERRQKR